MNPYGAPQNSSGGEQASTKGAIPRRFRWLVVPAAFSWCFGGIALLALPIGVYRVLEVLPIYPQAEWAEQLDAYASLSLVPALLVGGIANIRGGARWVEGKWAIALIHNAIAYGAMSVPGLLHRAALDAALQVPDWPL